MLFHLLTAALGAFAAADDSLAVIAVDVPPGPPAELVEMTHQLRAACREREAGVQDAQQTRARLLGATAAASLPELERAFAGALLTAAHGDAPAAARTLRGILDELERGPASAAAFDQWTRTQLRLAHTEAAAGHAREYAEALERVAELQPGLRLDPDRFSPTFRRDLEAARGRVAARAHVPLRIAATGSASAVEVFVDGRPLGAAPVSLQVTPGRHRIAGLAGALRVPAIAIDVGEAGGEATLDAELAAAVQVNAGPGLAVAAGMREAAAVKAGAWLETSRVLVTGTASEAGVTFLVGSLLDTRRGALLREGRVRTAGGFARGEDVAALAGFLITGKPSKAVVTSGSPAAALELSPVAVGAPAPARRAGWMRPAALASGGVALGLGALTVQQAVSAQDSSRAASALLRSDGTWVGDPARYARLRSAASSAQRNAWIGGAGTALFAATAGVLGVLSWDRGAPVVRF